MNHPPQYLKSFANRLGCIAASEQGTRLIRLLQLTELLGIGADASPSMTTGHMPRTGVTAGQPSAPNRIGIWEMTREAGKAAFVRSTDRVKEWHYWADLERIPPKSARRRIILTGESVARGYLYDPEYTPAMVLEKILESAWGKDEVEVIDLARNGIGLEIRELILSALQLEPDAVVIYAGNNWRGFYPPSRSSVAFIDTALREHGIAGVKQFADHQLAKEVTRMISDVAAAYRNRQIPLIWIVPEFNLGDWREPVTNAPHLPGERNHEWIDRWAAAQDAMRRADLHKAAELAGRMTELDGGICVAPLYILADCSRRLGDMDATRAFLELARDSVVWDPSKAFAARPLSTSQETLRQEARKNRNDLVDLPNLLKEHLEGGIPDRRLFVDYCHMTAEGIRISMAAAASCLLRSLRGVDVSWRALMADAPAPSQDVEGEAAFLAAIHNAHGGQSYDVVHYHCSRAVLCSPKIAEVMLCFSRLQTRRAPMLLCQEAQQIMNAGYSLLKQYILRYNHQQLDVLLLDAIFSSLKRVGIDAEPHVQLLRKEEHSVGAHEIDLLDYYFNSATLQAQEVVWVLPKLDRSLRQGADYYRAYSGESRFVFIGEEKSPVRLQLTCRLPNRDPSRSTASLQLNGSAFVELAINSDWTTFDLRIPGNTVVDGLNYIAICWPIPAFPGQEAYDGITDDLALGIVPEFFGCFGEIHTFTALNGRKAGKISALPRRKVSEMSVPQFGTL